MEVWKIFDNDGPKASNDKIHDDGNDENNGSHTMTHKDERRMEEEFLNL